ncbi:MAG: hypothetical protein GWN58_52425, partial [Anaerolineae bacterium]|nr:hypothetical protein [Anaerolineae bacterium]
RAVILVTGLITALVHLIWLNIPFIRETGSPDILFTLNGLGYLGLLALFFLEPAFLAEQWDFLHYIFIGYAAITIVAFLLLGDPSDLVGWFTKLDEVILIVAVWLHKGQDEAVTIG